jgi:hypothetical protein
MVTIRLSKAEWGKAWRAMIEVAPVRLVGDDPIYEVLPAHLDVLAAGGFTYVVVSRSQAELGNAGREAPLPVAESGRAAKQSFAPVRSQAELGNEGGEGAARHQENRVSRGTLSAD